MATDAEPRAVTEPTTAPAGRNARLTLLCLTGIVAVYAAFTVLAMSQTSATFDEILLPAAGSRGFETGEFNLIRLYHPRLMSYLYGLPVALSGVVHPPPAEMWMDRGGAFSYAYELFYGGGNDTSALVFRVRLLAVAVAVGLIVLVFAFARRTLGDGPALLAAAMVAFLPDLLAHGGIAYNDVGVALALFGAVWALDRAAAAPAMRAVVVAAVVTGLALCVKYSAIALAPMAVLLIAMEAAARGGTRGAYFVQVARMLPVAAVVAYLTVVAVYLGDFTLAEYREGFAFNIMHASDGHPGVPAWLLGEFSPDGFWYYFPAVFLIKTPVVFQALLVLGGVGLIRARGTLRDALISPLRGPFIGAAVFTGFLLASSLNIGFRHALPVLPFIVVLAAAGIARIWQAGRGARAAVVALVIAHAASSLSWYPHFLPYVSEYFPHRDEGHRLLTDSSHDWGQALPLLRRFMEEENVPLVYLSYFGSAEPAAYGIDYLPLQSFMPLRQPADAMGRPAPEFIAISATNLVGGYVDGVFSHLWNVEPYRVLGHSMLIFRLQP